MTSLVIAGARVWTDTDAGSVRFEQRTVWIRDGRVVDVAPASAAPPPGASSDLHVFDAAGKFLCPAFVDAHFHLIALANQQLRVDLSATTGARDVVGRLAEANAAEAGPLVGIDFDESDWADPTLPTRADLDAIDATRLVYARRVCCHVGVANSALVHALAARVPARFIDSASGLGSLRPHIANAMPTSASQGSRSPRPFASASSSASSRRSRSASATGTRRTARSRAPCRRPHTRAP